MQFLHQLLTYWLIRGLKDQKIHMRDKNDLKNADVTKEEC